MRLFSIAVGIVIAFGLGAWAISRLIAESLPSWIGVALSIVWLFLLIFAAVLISGGQYNSRPDQRRLLGYSLLAAVLMAAFLTSIFIYNIKLPKWAAETVLAAIAGAVYLFASYTQRRKLQRTVR